jgi:hypothetical protein
MRNGASITLLSHPHDHYAGFADTFRFIPWTVFLVAVEYFQEESLLHGRENTTVNVSRWPKAEDRWYLGVRCRRCRKPILFALDRGEGTGGDQPPMAAKLVLTCMLNTCRFQADYTAAMVTRFRKRPDKPGQAGTIDEGPRPGKPKRQR